MSRQGNWWGVILIAIGVVLLLSNLDLVDLGDLLRFWPLILIAIGARIVFGDRGSGSGRASRPPPPPL